MRLPVRAGGSNSTKSYRNSYSQPRRRGPPLQAKLPLDRKLAAFPRGRLLAIILRKAKKTGGCGKMLARHARLILTDAYASWERGDVDTTLSYFMPDMVYAV